MLKKLASSRKEPATTTRKMTYTIRVHALEPWPTLASGVAQSIAIGWTRGTAKRGTTRVARGVPVDGQGAKYTFEHEFTVDCTMTVRREGGVKAKELELVVLAVPEGRTPGEQTEGTPVGAVTMDLGLYLNDFDGVSDGYDVETSDGVVRAVGRVPKLYVTVAARASGEAPAALRALSSAATVRNVSLSPQRRDEPTPVVTQDMQGTGYQWASSRFRPEEESNAGTGTPASEQAAALTSMASMFKKRDQPAHEEPVSKTSEEAAPISTPEREAVEEDSAERSALFGAASPPQSTFAARDEEAHVVSENVAKDAPEDDAELAAARAALFGAHASRDVPVKTEEAAPDVDSDGFLLDSDLESDDDGGDKEDPEFAAPALKFEEAQELARVELARKAAEDAAREEEARRIAEEDELVAKLEAERKRAEDEARLLAERQALEAQRAEEERRRIEEETRLVHFEMERQRVEEEARSLAEQDAFDEEERRRAEEDAVRAAEERRRAEEEEAAREEEERQWAAEAEIERARIAAEEAREHEEALRAQRELSRAEEMEEEARLVKLEEERVLAIREHEQRLAEERAIQAAERAATMAAAAEAEAEAKHDKDFTDAAEISADASAVLFADDDSTMLRTPSHSNAESDAFYTPVARGSRFAESAAKPSLNRDLEDELVSMSICDTLIHGAAESTSFTPALGLQERIAAVRHVSGSFGARNELNRVVDAFQVAINGARGVNAARLTFICAQLVALRVCLAQMDDIDVHALIELEIVARQAALDTLWAQTFESVLLPKSATFDLLNVTLNGDGERVGRAWAAMFQFAKARLGVDAVDGTADTAGNSSKSLLKELQHGILIDVLLTLDERVLDVLIRGAPDAAVAAKIPGGGALTFSAGAELKRAISPLAKAAIDSGLGKSVDTLIPRLRATADICMIPKDALVDAKLRDDIVCGTLDAGELQGVITRFTPDDFAPQPVDQSIIDAVIASANASANAPPPMARRRAYVPASSEGAPWISALARALASVDGAALKPAHLPRASAHAQRWTIVTDALHTH